ncbi:MAG: N-acetylmuramoyl-L-alanine amidase [Brevundimonas sp.]|uniref:N-acetylmuramoyl-L-alanine amidase n=2 Tax=Brevundimonas TaxID=41275 RepID=A0ABY4SNQ9_9CAUL|nr:N-acetylmuramoyl-L-alanine amidase [Brevundimonas albigilva]PZU61907.1 MAG: N-acetylmuramoyl-L-alanine amidase [Brevundimonas sp.]UQV18671.1 N-acetylmuramoyl-L-alanine amidase [Brevundimonas albigilva]URI16550.1 N-acetylmuramoyl-L-alanine amidase [Brevundimonas albigilva]
MTLLAFVVVCAVVLAASRGFAWGAAGDVLGLRFGADGDRTRVVIDLDRTASGRVIEDGSTGRLILALSGVAAGQGVQGDGSGLVRAYRVAASGGASRIELDLSRGSAIERRFLLPPGDGVGHYRYVVDLKATGAAASAAARSIPRPAPPRRAEKPLVVIDAGHGGRDPGASGAQIQEKAVTLAAARQLKAELERTGRYRVRLTRDDDAYVDLYRRVSIARQADADLFISLHADAGADPALRGASVYTLSEQGAGRAVREFTRGDNWHRDLHLPGRDPSVDRILLDMTQRATQNRSAQFARVLLTHLEAAEHPLLRRSHRDAGLAVLLAPDVPAVLLEMGFITNPEDERALTDERARRRLMRAVAQGIDRYFQQPAAPVLQASNASASGSP